MKTNDDYFRDWENHVFGFGYGSGEELIIPALRRFLELCRVGVNNHAYDYRVLEQHIHPTVTWLLINALCHANLLEYGTSPRFGWLTQTGIKLRDYMLSKTVEELVELACDVSEGYAHCTPKYCNCGPNGYQEGLVCANPFWQ